MPAKDLKGMKFNSLTAQEIAGRDKHGNLLWHCECDCGQTTTVRASNLITGAVKSCGCAVKTSALTHGGSNTRLYRIWYGIIRRTEDKERKDYASCGGRGIRMCPEWRNDFSAFRDWALENGYSDGLVICRRDKAEDYSPANCFFGTLAELRKTGYRARSRNGF